MPRMGKGGGRAMLQKGDIKKLDIKTIKRLLSYLKGYKVRLVLVLFCIIISAIASVVSSLFIQTLIDDYITPLLIVDNPSFSGLLSVIMKVCVVFLCGIFSSFFYTRTMGIIAQSTLKDIRDEMFTHMQSLPIRYFDTNSNGDIMSHYTNDCDALRQMLSQTLPQLVSSVISMITVTFSMLHLSVYLTIFAFAFAFLSMFFVKIIVGKSGPFFYKQQSSLGDLNGYVEEMINGEKVVKVFSHEEKSKEVFDKKNDVLAKNMAKGNALSMVIMPLMGNLGNVLYVSIAFLGGTLAALNVPNISIGGEAILTVGTIASFLSLSRGFMNPITQVSQQLSSVILAMAGASRIFELLDEKAEEDLGTVELVNAKRIDGKLVECKEHTGIWACKEPKTEDANENGKAGELIELRGDIVLDKVDFSYIKGKEVLHNISIYAEPGQKVALVGATGAGKTTITNLINRFYDIDDGKIRYDGININHIKKDDLRRSLGVVLQDVNLFTGTVMENIRYGNPDATDEECINAAKLANADSFIRMLPKGYDTILEGDGSGLSQGQRQLLSIARAAVLDPPVMILDEATSSVDTRTETIIQRGMDNLMKGRTVFVIAHRLSTIQNSDVIMVMEKGRIIERGNHEKLLQDQGTYYRLYNGL